MSFSLCDNPGPSWVAKGAFWAGGEPWLPTYPEVLLFAGVSFSFCAIEFWGFILGWCVSFSPLHSLWVVSNTAAMPCLELLGIAWMGLLRYWPLCSSQLLIWALGQAITIIKFLHFPLVYASCNCACMPACRGAGLIPDWLLVACLETILGMNEYS